LYKFSAYAITISYRIRSLEYKWADQNMENCIAYSKDVTKNDSEIGSIIFCTTYHPHCLFMAEHLRLNCPTKILSPPNLYKWYYLIKTT
jgi:hypothetical protein